MYKSTYTSTYDKDSKKRKLLVKSSIGLNQGDCEHYKVVFVLFHNKSSSSWPFMNRSPRHLGCSHVFFFVDNSSFMNEVYSHYIYLSTYLKVKNVFLLKQLFHEQGLFSLHLSVYILEGKERFSVETALS